MSNTRGSARSGLAKPVEQNIYPVQETQLQSRLVGSFLDTLARKIATDLAATACCIYVLDQKRPELNPVAWYVLDAVANFEKRAIGEGIIGLAVVRAGQNYSPLKNSVQDIVRIDNFQHDGHFRSAEPEFPYDTGLVASIVTPDTEQLLGALLVAGKSNAPVFSSEDEQLLAAFSGRIDLLLALQNFRSQQEQERRNLELTIIHNFNQALAAAPAPVDLASACHTILGMPHLRQLFEFDLAELCLWEEQSQTLNSIERLPEDHAQIQSFGRTYQVNEGFTGWIAAHQESLLISDVQTQTEPAPLAGSANFPYRSYLGVPLKTGSEFLGTLELVAVLPGFYNSGDLALLEIIAGQAAIVLDHARRINLTDQQLQQRVEELGGLQRVSHELNSTLDLNKILSLVLEEAMRVTQASFGNVSLYDPQTRALTAHQERMRETDQPGLAQTVPVQNSIMGRALRSGQTVLVPDVRLDPDFIDYGRAIRSQIVVPIFYGGEPAGVINLESRNLNCFTADQTRYLEALANHAAVAIGNAQAFQTQKLEREQAGRRAGQLVRLADISNSFLTNRPLQEVLEDIAYAIVDSVGFNVVLISLVQGQPPVISHEVEAGIPLIQFNAFKALQAEQKQSLANLDEIMQDEFCLGRTYFIPAERMEVWRDRLDIPYVEKYQPDELNDQAATIDNAWQIGDLLFIPLKDTENKIIGLLTVQDPDTGQRPDPATLQTLETFANHAAAAIENARLFELEQDRRRLADTLRGVAETISSQLDLDQLLNVVLQELKKVVNYDSASVQLLQEDRLIIIGGHGWQDSQRVTGLSFPMEGHNPNRKVIEMQEPVIEGDVQKTYPASFSRPPHDRVRSWLGVPLTYGTNILGLMALDSHEVDFFTQENAEVVLAFANQVAVALQNAYLFDEARQQVRQLAALTEVAQSINRALDLDEILNLVLDAVFDLSGENKGFIWLIDPNTNTVKIANTQNIPNFLVEVLNESQISVEIEPFAKVIKSGQNLVVRGDVVQKDVIAHYGLPFPGDVTYVPLKTEESVIGILTIEGVIHHKNTLDLVTTLAN
ncbi:MAG: GAF domain-containing protein, partial [Chloroflexota bacterium]